MTGQLAVLYHVDEVLVNLCFWVSVAFPLITRRYWPWHQSSWGRNIVGLEVCIAATLLPSVLFFDWGIDFIALRWVSTISITLVTVIIVQRMLLIYREQARGRDADAARAREHSAADDS